ncbi:MAG: peptidoglycan D,D-transpeptidase FtsI family protein [Lachnospiraceae bacterium]
MDKKNTGANRNILRFTYVIVGVFACLVLYFAYFMVGSENVINNPYNARLDRFADRIVRGKILGSDGRVLAETLVDSEGNETRNYPYGEVFNHVAGYSTKGKSGLESLGNFYLLTSHVNLIEQAVNELSGVKNLGDSVITTLNVDLQQTAWDALGGRKGAVVVMEPDTGKILAMVSKPGFDPNTIDADWEQLIQGDAGEGILLNRAAQGLYPPGSTFKIITLLEYMREHPQDYQEFQFECDGLLEVEDYTIQCYHQTAHGVQTLEQAFANSCNGAFATLGLQLDLKRLQALTGELLFNTSLPLSLPYNQSSYQMGDHGDTWEILQTSIGQGATQMTPMHNLMLVSAIANGGILMNPYLIDHVENVGGETVKNFMPSSYGKLMTAQEASDLSRYMRSVVTEGTGSALNTEAYSVAGKTGSAEFEAGKETHAWFVGFAPAEDPQIAVSVIVEEGGSGGRTAGPVARSIFDTYLLK